jgi:hypothetical protein
MAIEISTPIFVKPRQALQIVGRECFGQSWREDCIDDEFSTPRDTALRSLRAALQSGEVRASWHHFDGEHPLQPYQAAGEFFRINLRDDCVHLDDGAPQRCRIHAADLVKFIRVAGRTVSTPTIFDERDFERWLLARMASDEPMPVRDVLWGQAKERYPLLTKAAFLRARKVARGRAEQDNLPKAGRPKRPA